MTKLLTCFVRPITFALLALTPVIFVGARASADDGQPADPAARAASAGRLGEEGLTLYKDRDYRRATESFLQAYTLEPDPNLLFNIARCYEASGDRDGAIEKYEAFLSKADADPQGKRRATEALRALRQGKETPSAVAAPPAATVGDPGRVTLVPSVEPRGTPSPAGLDARASRRSEPAMADQANSSFLTARVVVLGVGVATTVVGAVAYAMGAADHNKVTSSAGYGAPGQVNPMTEGEARRLVDSGDTKKLVGGIAMGLGGVLLATAAFLYLSGPRGDTPAREVAPPPLAFGLSPLGGGGGQIFLRRTFQ